MPPSVLLRLANHLLLDGEQIRSSGTNLTTYYQEIGLERTSVATASKGLGMSRRTDPVRAIVTYEDSNRSRPRIALGPSAGLVLGISVGSASIRGAIVDANGWIYSEQRDDPVVGQLDLRPAELFDRIKRVGERVFDGAFKDERLLVDDAMPFLGLAVSWPAPLDRGKVPRNGLSHHEWSAKGSGIHERLARHLRMPVDESHAVNDAYAATLAVVFDHTRSSGYRRQTLPELTMVVRIAGGIGAAAMGAEPPREGVSGWMGSRLVGGANELAGELGHFTVNLALLRRLAASVPPGCPEITPIACSCAPAGEFPDHVEAYASGRALAARFASVYPSMDPPGVVRRILAEPKLVTHRRALQDIGFLIADSLVPAILMLNPSRIVLTGRLATPEVRDAVEELLEQSKTIERLFGVLPDIHALTGEQNDYIGVRGAALAVFRRHVHRKLSTLYGAPMKIVPGRFGELTRRVDAYPWR